MVSCPSTLIPTSEYKPTNEKPVFETSCVYRLVSVWTSFRLPSTSLSDILFFLCLLSIVYCGTDTPRYACANITFATDPWLK